MPLLPLPLLMRTALLNFIAGGYYGQYVDLDGNFKTEYDMVKKYRVMAMHPEVDSAIEDIIQEAIVTDQNDSPVQIGSLTLRLVTL